MRRLKPLFVLGIVVLSTLFAGCGKIIDEKSCVSNEDCACGRNKYTNDCFFGNKEYVDTTKQCPDFCTGIAGHLRVVCSDNKCVQVSIKPQGFCGTSTSGSCVSSDDCITGGCSSQVCQSKDEKPVITTCEYKDCYNSEAYNLSCQCIDNKCEWGAK